VTAASHLPGLFIAFEGGDGCGKSTQIGRLTAHLDSLGLSPVRTREPGPATSIGPKIRQILLDPANADLDDRTEALLFAADRAQHAATLLRPALNDGKIVLTDRYIDSSLMYQGVGRGLGIEAIRALSVFATDNLMPDLTLILDLPTREGKGRATKTEFGTADRIESAAEKFHDTNRQGFLDLAATDPNRYAVIDASGTEDEVEAAIWSVVAPLLATRIAA
jgi:dTMP kinase